MHGTYPPAYLADADGTPAHSWRVVLLPLLGQQELYDAYRFDEPWNGPHNRELAQRMPDIYRCDWNMDRRSVDASYVVVGGAHTIFAGAAAAATVPDGTSNTLLVVELAESGINWLEPRDLEFDKIDFDLRSGEGKYLCFSHPRDGLYAVHGVFADGHPLAHDALAGKAFRAIRRQLPGGKA